MSSKVQAKEGECDQETYNLYRELATADSYTLGFSDYLFLTGHFRCCGPRLDRDLEEEANAKGSK